MTVAKHSTSSPLAKQPPAGHGECTSSDFTPPWWARNRHVQTLWPRFVQKRIKVPLRRQRLELPDGDFVDLAWCDAKSKPVGLAIVFHGLEGSVESHYASSMMHTLHEDGWLVVLMHFRGCSGELNRTTRAYHSGETSDGRHLLQWLQQQYPGLPMVAVGFSLGGNMLLKMLGEDRLDTPLTAAVSVSAPLKLDECARSINQGFSRVYQAHLLKSMNRNLLAKMQVLDYSAALSVTEDQVNEFRSFYHFDEHVTAPLHGFAGADDYYQQCSAIGFLQHISAPTLILHAEDDPFMNPSVVPSQEQLSPWVRAEISRRGGHVGFVQGKPWASYNWFHRRVSNYFLEVVK